MSENPLRVVIAEDEALIRMDLKEMLEEEGYVVAGEAGDGAAAVKLAEDLRPNLVIMDVKMPVLDGISAAGQITSQHLAPVVILTAFSQRDLVKRAGDAGAMAFLVKPFTRAELVPAIEIAVTRFQEISALEKEVGSLRERLEVRKLLDRAKAKLQAEQQLTEAQAFRFIQKSSMDRRMTMRAVAEEVLAAGEPPSGQAGEQAATRPARSRRAAPSRASRRRRPAAPPASPARLRARLANRGQRLRSSALAARLAIRRRRPVAGPGRLPRSPPMTWAVMMTTDLGLAVQNPPRSRFAAPETSPLDMQLFGCLPWVHKSSRAAAYP